MTSFKCRTSLLIAIDRAQEIHAVLSSIQAVMHGDRHGLAGTIAACAVIQHVRAVRVAHAGVHGLQLGLAGLAHLERGGSIDVAAVETLGIITLAEQFGHRDLSFLVARRLTPETVSRLLGALADVAFDAVDTQLGQACRSLRYSLSRS